MRRRDAGGSASAQLGQGGGQRARGRGARRLAAAVPSAVERRVGVGRPPRIAPTAAPRAAGCLRRRGRRRARTARRSAAAGPRGRPAARSLSAMAAAALRRRAFSAGAALGRVERLGVALADEQRLDEGRGLRRAAPSAPRRPARAARRRGPCRPSTMANWKLLAGLQQRQRPVDGPGGGLAAGAVAVEAEGRLGMVPPEHLHLVLGQRRAHAAPRPATPARWQAITSM